MGQTLSIVLNRLKPYAEQLPPGYEARQVLPWSSPVMQSYGYSVNRGGNPVGQFQVVTCFVWSDTIGRWAGQWSAVSNFNTLTGADLLDVARLQLLEFGYSPTISDAELIAMRSHTLPDGYTLHQKMDWLYKDASNGGPGTILWGTGDWWACSEAKYGTMVNGGQWVAVKQVPRTFHVQMPERPAVEAVRMRELLTFSRADFGKSHAAFPYLTQWATVANLNDSYGEYPRGHVACPVALNPAEFDFSGQFQPTGYFLPEVWMDLT